jgi:hypothetical protein
MSREDQKRVKDTHTSDLIIPLLKENISFYELKFVDVLIIWYAVKRDTNFSEKEFKQIFNNY